MPALPLVRADGVHWKPPRPSHAWAEPHRPLFEPVTFEVLPGQAWHLEGPNGVGKSTLLRGIAGLEAMGGTLTWWGRDRVGSLRERVGYVGHATGLCDAMTGRAYLGWYAAAQGVPTTTCQERLAAVPSVWGLAAVLDRPIHDYSAGQRRRLALLRLVVAQPQLWLVDEPLDHLDTEGQATWWALCKAHLARGGGLVMTGHQAMHHAPFAYQRLALHPTKPDEGHETPPSTSSIMPQGPWRTEAKLVGQRWWTTFHVWWWVSITWISVLWGLSPWQAAWPGNTWQLVVLSLLWVMLSWVSLDVARCLVQPLWEDGWLDVWRRTRLGSVRLLVVRLWVGGWLGMGVWGGWLILSAPLWGLAWWPTVQVVGLWWASLPLTLGCAMGLSTLFQANRQSPPHLALLCLPLQTPLLFYGLGLIQHPTIAQGWGWAPWVGLLGCHTLHLLCYRPWER